MSLGLIGRKVGMTRVFNDDGTATPVTVIDVSNNRVSQVKSTEHDGYAGVQVTFGDKRATRVTKAQAGHFGKAGVQAGAITREFRADAGELKAGSIIGADTFTVGQEVDVTGTTKGRGFSGVIRRHNFSSNRASHGNSVTTRAPGSIGMAQDPGRVFPGKRMAGQYGNAQRTVQALTVVRVDAARGLLMIKGAVPGTAGGHVIVKPTVRS
ncbi:MAG: 50S ribosomal protein L3 [Burkholderiales bacterium]|nr:50S ribosomal protein L3 [Burkholderiales bacterium]